MIKFPYGEYKEIKNVPEDYQANKKVKEYANSYYKKALERSLEVELFGITFNV